MKKTIISSIFFLLFIAVNSMAQSYHWAKHFKATDDATASSIATDSVGSVYTIGYHAGTVDFDPGPGVFNSSSPSAVKRQMFISKLDSSGNFAWAKNLATSDQCSLNDITADYFGNLYLTGRLNGTVDFDLGPMLYNQTALSGMFILKLDLSGNFQWVRALGVVTTTAGGTCEGIDITTDDSGNVYVTGSVSDSVDFDPGPGIVKLGGNGDVFVAKYDPAGNLIWARVVNGANTQPYFINSQSTSLKADISGNTYFTGIFRSTVDFDPGPGIYALTPAGPRDEFIAKLDGNGNFLWARQFAGPGDIYQTPNTPALALDKFANVYTTGTFTGTVDFDPGPATANLISEAGSPDIFISRLDKDGNFVWAKKIGGTAPYYSGDYAANISVDSSSTIYLTGTFNGTVDLDPGPAVYIPSPSPISSFLSTSFFVSRLDPMGNLIAAKVVAGWGNHTCYANTHAVDRRGNIFTAGDYIQARIDFDPDVGIDELPSNTTVHTDMFIQKLGRCNVQLKAKQQTLLCAGQSVTLSANGSSNYTWSPGGSTTASIAVAPAVTTEYTVNGTAPGCSSIGSITVLVDPCAGLKTEQNDPGFLSVYPNPNNGGFMIQGDRSIDLKLINALGQVIDTIRLSDKNNYTFRISDKAAGIYYLVSEKESRKIIVTK